jgi:hypothetical protein
VWRVLQQMKRLEHGRQEFTSVFPARKERRVSRPGVLAVSQLTVFGVRLVRSALTGCADDVLEFTLQCAFLKTR